MALEFLDKTGGCMGLLFLISNRTNFMTKWCFLFPCSLRAPCKRTRLWVLSRFPSHSLFYKRKTSPACLLPFLCSCFLSRSRGLLSLSRLISTFGFSVQCPPTSSDSHEGLPAPAKMLLQSLAHGLQHNTVDLGDWMGTMKDDLLL